MILRRMTTGCADSICILERQEPGREIAGKGARMVDEVAALDASVVASVPYPEASSERETSSAGYGRTVEHSGTVEHRNW